MSFNFRAPRNIFTFPVRAGNFSREGNRMHLKNAVLPKNVLVGLCTCVFVTVGSAADNVAVMNLKNASGVSQGEAELISDRLRVELFRTGSVNVMERDQMQEILKEQGFQQSGACTDEACLVEVGQLLGVKSLVTGSIGKLGSIFMVNLRMIDVSTARISKVVSKDIRGEIEEVVDYLPEIAAQLVGGRKPEVQPEPEPEKELPESVADGREDEDDDNEAEEATQEDDAAADKVIDSEEVEENRNRSGVGICFGILPGSGFYDLDNDVYFIGDNNENFARFKHFRLKFIIRAGNWLCVE
ncbi:MAG: hypothetical protein GF398_12290, partial [Chitinivibrionales bacterium]|nr:hypothetical protein [Chitinivibrionales bacterium]